MSPRAHGRLATCAGVLGLVALGASAVLLWQRPAAGTEAYLSDVETVRVAVTGVPGASARDAEAPRPAPPAVTSQHAAPEGSTPAPVDDAPPTKATTGPVPEPVEQLVEEIAGESAGEEQADG